MRIINAYQTYISIIIFICFVIFSPGTAYSTCDNIPTSYPLFSNSKINLAKDTTVNGIIIPAGAYAPNAAIAIDGSVSTNVYQTLPDLNPPFFPANSNNTNLDIKSDSTITHNSEVFYHDIKIKKKGITIDFTGGSPFNIDELKVEEKDVILNFGPGTYYLDKFKVNNDNITVNTSGPVIFYIGSEFKIEGANVNINTGGNVDDLRVYLHAGAKFETTKSNFNFTGLVYGPFSVEKVSIKGDNSSIRGAIIIDGGPIELGQTNFTHTYTAADQTAIGNISTCNNGGGGGDTVASKFNCVENGANGISGKLYTKTTSQSFSFDIVALQDASTIETSFASGIDHTVTVELVNANTGNGLCSQYSALIPAISQTLAFTTTDSGTKASASMSSSKAYPSVRCRVTDTTSIPYIIDCSTDKFAIRPTTMSITSNLTNTGSTGTPKAKAGESFTLTATATTGYSGTPLINNSNILAHAGAIQIGSISGSFSAADSATGIATGTDAFSYSEVGSLRFLSQGVYDDSFTAVDQSGDCTDDFSNSVVSGKVGCKFGNTSSSAYFGRFTPDHFVLSNKNIEDRNNLSCIPDSSFTYIGETFQTSFTLTAENSSNNTTQNYTGIFAKLDGSDLNFGAIDLADAAAPISATALSSQLSLVSTSGSWTNGVANMTAILGIARTNPEGPFESFNLGIAPVDSDGITVPSYDLDTSAPSDSNDKELLATTKIRFGRLNIENAHGSELLDLPIPMHTEYYNGTNFVTNTDDSCTPINTAQLSFNGGTNPVTAGSGTSTASIANSPLALGLAGLSLSAPGANNTGFIDITSSIFISSFPWLSYDWDDDGSHDDSPSDRATFGIYKGYSNQIYLREVY